MRDITRAEADYLRKHLPSAYIVVTSKHKKGRAKRYAVEETKVVRDLLTSFNDNRTTRYDLSHPDGYGVYRASFVPGS